MSGMKIHELEINQPHVRRVDSLEFLQISHLLFGDAVSNQTRFQECEWGIKSVFDDNSWEYQPACFDVELAVLRSLFSGQMAVVKPRT